MFALVDGNNFYVSCERVFRPSLNGRPVIVLSSNDGCAIARSNEAKALGIKMGAPWFQIRHMEETHGLVTALPAQDLDDVLAATLVEEVWGVGRKIGAQLHQCGVHTVLDLARLDPAMVRRRWSVVLERTVRELQGMQCIELDDVPEPKREIACTRSFGQAVTELPPLVEAVSEFASRAAEKLRKQGSLASQLLVFCHTSPFRPGPRFNKSVVVPLRRPTADTGKLVWAATAGMRRMYEPGYKMAKAGVMLLDLVPGNVLQGELDLEDEDHRDRTQLMVALDALNQRYGKGTVHSGATGGTNKGKDWGMKQERRTPQYATRWEDVPVARA